MDIPTHHDTTQAKFTKTQTSRADRNRRALRPRTQARPLSRDIQRGIEDLKEQLKSAKIDPKRRGNILTHMNNRINYRDTTGFLTDSKQLLNAAKMKKIKADGDLRAEEDLKMKTNMVTTLAAFEDFNYFETKNEKNNGTLFDLIVRAIVHSNHFCKRYVKKDKTKNDTSPSNMKWEGVDANYLQLMFYNEYKMLRTDLSVLLITSKAFNMNEFVERVNAKKIDDQLFIKYLSFNLAAFAIIHLEGHTIKGKGRFNYLYIDIICSNTVLASPGFENRYAKMLNPAFHYLSMKALALKINFLALNTASPGLEAEYAPYGFTRDVNEISEMLGITKNQATDFLKKKDHAGWDDDGKQVFPYELFMVKKINDGSSENAQRSLQSEPRSLQSEPPRPMSEPRSLISEPPRPISEPPRLMSESSSLKEWNSTTAQRSPSNEPPSPLIVQHSPPIVQNSAPNVQRNVEPEYIVEDIIDKRTRGRKTEYLVKWKGFPGQDTWEPRLHLLTFPGLKSMLDAYDKSQSVIDIPDGFYEIEDIIDKRTVNGNVEYYIKWRGYDENTWESRTGLLDGNPALQPMLDAYDRKLIDKSLVFTDVDDLLGGLWNDKEGAKGKSMAI